jgi:hypothetical protein
MKRSAFDIDNKVLAGLIVGVITFALTKLAIPLDPQIEQIINLGAAVLAAYLVPSKVPPALTGESDEEGDIIAAPTVSEITALESELAQPAPATVDDLPDPDFDDELGDVPDLPTAHEASMWQPADLDEEPPSGNGHGAVATVAPPEAVELDEDVDETELYGEVNATGLTEAEVEEELDSEPLGESDDDGPPPAPRRV